MPLVFFFLLIFGFLEAGDRWDYMLRTHSDITWNERNELFLNQICDKIAKKHNLIVHLSNSSMQPFENCKWAYSFFSMEMLNVTEASALLKKVYTDILTEIHHNREAVIFLTQDVDAKTFPTDLVALKLSFFQKDKLRCPAPYIARIYISEGHMHYNLAIDNQLQNPIALN